MLKLAFGFSELNDNWMLLTSAGIRWAGWAITHSRNLVASGATASYIFLVCTHIFSRLVFYYQNCSDLLWEKTCSSHQEKLLKLEAKGREYAKFLRSLEQFIQTVKGQKKFWWQDVFLIFLGGFSYLMI